MTVNPISYGSFRIKEPSEPDVVCNDCSLEVDGAFGQDAESLGVHYVLHNASVPVVAGAAILERTLGISGGMQSVAGWDSISGAPAVNLEGGVPMMDFRLSDGLLLSFGVDGQHVAKTSGLDWTQGVAIAIDDNGFPLALGGATSDMPILGDLSGELVFTLDGAKTNGVVLDDNGELTGQQPVLQGFELTLSDLTSDPKFTMDMEVGVGTEVYRAHQADPISLTYPYETWIPFAFGLQVSGTEAADSPIHKDAAPCPECTLDALGVFSQDAQHSGVVYQLKDDLIRTIQGAAILERQ